jgi:holo-[acyl-carrier protein] synthase
MPIIGIGLDVTSISRIEQSLERYGERFLNRVFHPQEVAFSQKRKKNAEYLAACFAVKEAALKAMGDFPGRGIDWADIYVTHEPTGKPVVHFEGKARALFDEKGAASAFVSITHDGDTAIAQVILEG